MRASTTALVALVMAGCSGSIGDTTSDAPGSRTGSTTSSTVTQGGYGGAGPSGSGAATSGSSGTTSTGSTSSGAGGAPGSGSFCDVENVLRSRCQSCHTSPLPVGVPMPLVTYADLMAPAKTDPTRRVADLCIARMQDPTRPMPPAPATPASSSEIAAFETWIAAGAPSTCMPGGGTGGTGGAGPGTPDAGVVQPPVVCTSNQHWTRGNSGSASMRPGGACISCHTMSGGEAPRFQAAGTVYPTVREPDDCNGINGTTTGTTVVIVDANNHAYTVPVNSVGNFYMETGTIALPFHAKVVRAGMERVMVAAQMSGDCNSCHTQDGANMAPGRIVAP